MDELQTLIKDKNIYALALLLFDLEVTEKQTDIIRTIAFKESKRIVISCMTQYGKSFSVALGILFFILFNENKKVNLIAPLNSQTKIIRNYISDFIVRSPMLMSLVDTKEGGIERLKKEVSKKRITFKNGCEFNVFSAEGKATRLMGWAGDLTIVDEAGLIDTEVHRVKIRRMLVTNPEEKMYVSIGNPWDKDTPLYRDWTDPDFLRIHIDWRIAVKEGRTTIDAINKERENLTEREFKVLYEAEFPEDMDDSLISFKWIELAKNKEATEKEGVYYLGADIARFGNDLSVLTIVKEVGDQIEVVEIKEYSKQNTAKTSGQIIELIKRYKPKRVNIDDGGLGGGVVDQLKEAGYNVEGINFGSRPITDEGKERFLNAKAEMYFNLRTLFEKGQIKILNHRQLIRELNLMRYHFNSRGKIIMDDPEKSPDFADSLALACYFSENSSEEFFFSKI